MLAFGTRPEAIKMCPLVNELRKRNGVQVIVCITGQHKQMLFPVLELFNIKPEYDLAIMKDNQTLFDVTLNILSKIKPILEQEKPDIVLVHGDTTTTFSVSLACYYLKIKIGHVEAGLRTNNIYSPFPEEFNRQAVDIISNLYFASTEKAKENLLKEGKLSDNIYITGNTVIDALKTTVKDNYVHPILSWVGNDKLIIVTVHRRENIGTPMINIFKAIKRIAIEYPNIKIIYPIHLNPNVRKNANIILGKIENIKIIEPLDVFDFHNFLNKSYIILTDSGGIQEEAPSLGKPVLVVRDNTERPEGVEAGTLKLVGTKEKNIYLNLKLLLDNQNEYNKMSKASNPYGDGLASIRIANIIEDNI